MDGASVWFFFRCIMLYGVRIPCHRTMRNGLHRRSLPTASNGCQLTDEFMPWLRSQKDPPPSNMCALQRCRLRFYRYFISEIGSLSFSRVLSYSVRAWEGSYNSI